MCSMVIKDLTYVFFGERILHMCSMVIEDLTYVVYGERILHMCSIVRGSYICVLW